MNRPLKTELDPQNLDRKGGRKWITLTYQTNLTSLPLSISLKGPKLLGVFSAQEMAQIKWNGKRHRLNRLFGEAHEGRMFRPLI